METQTSTARTQERPRRRLGRKAIMGLLAAFTVTAVAAGALSIIDREQPTAPPATTTQKEATQASQGARFRIASFNLLGSGHTDGRNPRRGYDKSPVRLKRALQVLANNKVDIVGLQEMHGSQQDLWATIASPTWRTYPMNTMSDSSGHNSIAWRHDTFVSVEKKTIGVPYFYGKPIQMPYVLLEHRASGERAWFINVHNPADTFGNAEKWRVAALKVETDLVARLRAANPDIPVFLTGDMNERRDFICPAMRNSELESAQPGAYLSGSTCVTPKTLMIDWVTGTPDVTFWGWQSVRDSLVKATTDHPLIVANADIPPRWLRSRGYKHVVVLSLEGIRSATIQAPETASYVPNLRSIRAQSANTLNARTAYWSTNPLPNAFTTLTGRPVVRSLQGHGMTRASDPGGTAHAYAGQYVSSVFDMVHNRGLSTALYSSDAAATAMVRTWNSKYGGGDNFTRDNGRGKISTSYINGRNDRDTVRRVLADIKARPATFSYVQLATLGRLGTTYGYSSARYRSALTTVDSYVGQIFNAVKNNPAMAKNTLFILTSGSGGVAGGSDTQARYTVPLFVWGNGVPAGRDLYDLNPDWKDPGTARYLYDEPQPIFNGVIANLAVGALGIGRLPRGSINPLQNFTVFASN